MRHWIRFRRVNRLWITELGFPCSLLNNLFSIDTTSGVQFVASWFIPKWPSWLNICTHTGTATGLCVSVWSRPIQYDPIIPGITPFPPQLPKQCSRMPFTSSLRNQFPQQWLIGKYWYIYHGSPFQGYIHFIHPRFILFNVMTNVAELNPS